MIYIHVPFCHRKCTYCAFYSKPVVTHSSVSPRGATTSPKLGEESDSVTYPSSSPNLGEVPEGRRSVFSGYVDALIEEMRLRRGEQAHPIKTIYFGGGTPSILAISDLERIVKALREHFDLSQVEEVTMECNPEDLTGDYIHGIRQLGLINRLSIGIQSLDDSVLRMIGRRHTAQQAMEAVENAYYAGFHNISVDIIYGLPGMAGFTSMAGMACLAGMVTHFSAYALTVEHGTALAVQVEQGRLVLPDEDEVVSQYFALHKILENNGFRQYEVSNYARPGFESKHNSRYWNRTPYVGLGPGAHSFDGFCRRWNNSDGSFEYETLTEADAFNELLMTSLRTVRGLPLDSVPEEQKGRLHRMMQPFINSGWIVLRANHYCPTVEGLLHADGIAAALFV